MQQWLSAALLFAEKAALGAARSLAWEQQSPMGSEV